MTREEKSIIIGHHRNGASHEQIALVYGISKEYVGIIVDEYLKNKK